MAEPKRYSSISTLNHWVTALLVVVLLAFGFAAAAAPLKTTENYVLGIHISLGFFAFLVVIWRVAFRLYEGFPQSIAQTAMERLGAYVTHRAILILLMVQIVTGPWYVIAENECMNVFGWFSVCLPLESLSTIYEIMKWIHVYSGKYLLPAVLLFHFIGAVRHYTISPRMDTPADM